MAPQLILINPWIVDFAAYDFWSKPLGLLQIAGYLRNHGFKIHFIDCLDVHHPGMKKSEGYKAPIRRAFGTGKYWRTRMEKPEFLAHIPRPYSRYGLSQEVFVRALQEVEKPSAILVTSLMTYWYPGVQAAISLARKVHPDVPVLLGGIYARLCRTHALRYSGADFVAEEKQLDFPHAVIDILVKYGVPIPADLKSGPSYPAFDLLNRPEYVCIATSSGCPYGCRYCAGPFLNPRFTQRNTDEVLAEILHWQHSLGITDIAFYDDALLVCSDTHINPLLNKIIERKPGLRFHVPNALHVREISPVTARLLRKAGFQTLRLGLETTDKGLRGKLDRKIGAGDFENAVKYLRDAGFDRQDIGVYVLMGLPGQPVQSVIETLSEVDHVGAVPYLAEYSPIPHTSLWEQAVAASGKDLSEPLLQNNTLIPCWDEEAQSRVPELREMAGAIRRSK
jgi:radical SAM superfamily enzyme YgiQ (UPF0313 family)